MMKELNMLIYPSRSVGTPVPMAAISTGLQRTMIVRGHVEAATTSIIALLPDKPVL